MLYAKKTFDYEYPVSEADVCIVGVPFTSTEIGQPVKYGPLFIREAIRNLVGYNPETKKNIFNDYKFHDAGDIEVVPGSWKKTEEVITSTIADIYSDNKNIFPIFIGGEHIISLAILKAIRKIKNRQMTVIDFDAHMDLLPDWLGEEHSHITWAYHLMGTKNFDMVQIGPRIYSKEEEKNQRKFEIKKSIARTNNPVYISIDLDVLDPSVAPEVGTQQAGGMTLEELRRELKKLKGMDIVGMDIVECSSTEVETRTAHIAAELIRTVLEIKK